jgi:hypothetical protein
MKHLLLYIICSFSLTASWAQLIPYRVNEKWGYSDTSGKIIIEPQYDETEFFTEDFAFIKIDTLYYGINSTGKIITEAYRFHGDFSEGLCHVQNTKLKSYYINTSGQSEFNKNYEALESFSEGLAVVSVNKKLGIINRKGEWVRPPNFDTSSQKFQSGFLLGLSKGKYFYIDKQGTTLSLPDSIIPAGIFSEGIAAVYVKTRSKIAPYGLTYVLQFIDSSGQIIMRDFINDSFDYSEYITIEKEFRDGKCVIKNRNDLGWDYYFLDRQKRFSPLFSYAKHIGDSLYLGILGMYMPDFRIMDKNFYVMGQFQTKPTQVGEIGNGLIPVRDKEGKWGYMNSNCRLLIPHRYDGASAFKNGYAMIIINQKRGVINTQGKHFFKD